MYSLSPACFQETRIRASEKDPQSKVQNICVSNQYGGEEVTHTLTTDSREDTHRWMEAFWQHFYDMSKYCGSACDTSTAHTKLLNFKGLVNVLCLPLGVLKMTVHLQRTGQWKQCCDDLMKIELPSPRKPAPVTPKQGSLYHEMGENLSLVASLCDHKISLVTFISSRKWEKVEREGRERRACAACDCCV